MRIDIARLIPVVLLAALPIGSAHAAQRTFVATSGNDANACSLVAPCRSFGQAITATDASGEIVVLDSGGYGRVTIDKSVTIHAPAGIYAGISVFGGTDGIDIATPGLQVALRGLTINGQGGISGIAVTAASTVDVERCVVAHMTQYGIVADVANVDLSIKDSSLQDNGSSGLHFHGGMQFRVERSRIERNGSNGMSVQDASGAVADTLIAGSAISGLAAAIQAVGGTMAITVTGSRIHQNALTGILVQSIAAGTFKFEGSDNVISDNLGFGVAVSASGGATVLATLRRNAIAHNGNSGVSANSGATLNMSDNVVVGNDSRGLVQATGGVLNSRGNNVVRDNTLGDSQGVISPFGGV